MSSVPSPPQPDDSSPWERAAKALAQNPDSPQSLQILSVFNQAMRPLQAAADQVVEAMVARLETPDSPAAIAAVDAAIGHWERACGGSMDSETRALFERDALAALDRRNRQPPSLESILGPLEGRTDYGYELAGSLDGLRGTWHRLWAALVLERTLGDLDQLSATLRAEFERLLGRALTGHEWEELSAHAARRVQSLQAKQNSQGG